MPFDKGNSKFEKCMYTADSKKKNGFLNKCHLGFDS